MYRTTNEHQWTRMKSSEDFFLQQLFVFIGVHSWFILLPYTEASQAAMVS
jgi:hypothetical protein